MSEHRKTTVIDTPLAAIDEQAKTHALLAYVLMAVGLFTALFWFIGAFWAMVKRSDARASLFEDHYTNLIKVFWWGLPFYIIGFVLTIILVGYIILAAVWLWSAYRLVKGLAKLTSNKAYQA